MHCTDVPRDKTKHKKTKKKHFLSYTVKQVFMVYCFSNGHILCFKYCYSYAQHLSTPGLAEHKLLQQSNRPKLEHALNLD